MWIVRREICLFLEAECVQLFRDLGVYSAETHRDKFVNAFFRLLDLIAVLPVTIRVRLTGRRFALLLVAHLSGHLAPAIHTVFGGSFLGVALTLVFRFLHLLNIIQLALPEDLPYIWHVGQVGVVQRVIVI